MDFILEIPGNLSPEICEQMMEKFEGDDRTREGITADGKSNSPYKKSEDLNISGLEEWKDIDDYLCKQLRVGIAKYKEHICNKVGAPCWLNYSMDDSGYQIQKTVQGQYYSWHSDDMFETKRQFTFLWYLNTFDTNIDGGGTAFHPSIGGGKVIKPEQGKLILFPATWTYVHMGLPVITPDKSKYVCTGWIHSKNAV